MTRHYGIRRLTEPPLWLYFRGQETHTSLSLEPRMLVSDVFAAARRLAEFLPFEIVEVTVEKTPVVKPYGLRLIAARVDGDRVHVRGLVAGNVSPLVECRACVDPASFALRLGAAARACELRLGAR